MQLQKALSDSQKNASLLSEYHQLYELQRRRLEKTIQLITDERELWIKTAYGVSLKVFIKRIEVRLYNYVANYLNAYEGCR